jgi:hypothetical protein
MSFSGYIANWSPAHVAKINRYLEGYRAFRHLTMQDFYALTPYPRYASDWDVAQFSDPQTAEAVVLAYRVRGDQGRHTAHPRRLDPAKTYQVVNPFAGDGPATVATATGQELMEHGIAFSLDKESAAVRHLKPMGG